MRHTEDLRKPEDTSLREKVTTHSTTREEGHLTPDGQRCRLIFETAPTGRSEKKVTQHRTTREKDSLTQDGQRRFIFGTAHTGWPEKKITSDWIAREGHLIQQGQK